jgi:hypothetical protein
MDPAWCSLSVSSFLLQTLVGPLLAADGPQ